MSRDTSEIILICWFAAQDTFIIIINVETENISEETMTRKFKRTCEIEIYNIINVFTVMFDQCNASLLNKSINLFFKNSYWPQSFER